VHVPQLGFDTALDTRRVRWTIHHDLALGPDKDVIEAHDGRQAVSCRNYWEPVYQLLERTLKLVSQLGR
jgi:hypothetical protein